MPATTTKRPAVKRAPRARKPAAVTPTPSAPVVEPAPSEPVQSTEATPVDDGFWTLLSHPNFREKTRIEYFYDGEITVRNGVAKIPKNKRGWVSRLLFSGYGWANDEEPNDFARTL